MYMSIKFEMVSTSYWCKNKKKNLIIVDDDEISISRVHDS